jgi:hypothetical protein
MQLTYNQYTICKELGYRNPEWDLVEKSILKQKNWLEKH